MIITEDSYIGYFTNLATQNKILAHVPGTNDTFFYLPSPWDLSEIDNVIKSSKGDPIMLLDAMAGQLDDSMAQNHQQIINAQITIIKSSTLGKADTIRAARDLALPLCVGILARLRKDCRPGNNIFNGAVFSISKVAFDPVGPMLAKYYGYSLRFKITCPFGFTVDSGSWSDIAP